MIDPLELRKGNIIEYNGEQVKVVGFDEEYVYLNIATVDYVGFDEVFPIELNGNIILKLGFCKSFKHVSNSLMFQKEEYVISHSIQSNWQFWVSNTIVSNAPQTLHRLQNIYLELSGSELQLTN